MKNWIISIGIIIVILSILTIIFPSNKLGKFSKGIFSLIAILVIIKPIVNFSNNNYNIGYIDSSEIVIQNEFIDYINFCKISNLKSKCEMILNNYQISNVNIDIIYENLENNLIIKKCVINLSNAVINSDKEHIHIIEESRKTISKLLSIDESKVIYEE